MADSSSFAFTCIIIKMGLFLECAICGELKCFILTGLRLARTVVVAVAGPLAVGAELAPLADRLTADSWKINLTYLLKAFF